MPRWLTIALVAAALLLLATACGPREQVGPPAPSSSLTKEQALRAANLASITVGSPTIGTFAGTGSMLPLLDSRTVAVWEPVTPDTRLHPGDIVAFERSGHSIAHTVTAVEGQHVRTRGVNNDSSDSGWQRPTLRLVALVYSTR